MNSEDIQANQMQLRPYLNSLLTTKVKISRQNFKTKVKIFIQQKVLGKLDSYMQQTVISHRKQKLSKLSKI